MIAVEVPIFDEFQNYRCTGYALVKIKNRPDLKDHDKITRLLPGFCCGPVGPQPLSRLLTDGRVEIRSFYDARQDTRQFRNQFVRIVGATPRRSIDP